MATIPTEEQLRQEIRETINANPQFKMCINCLHFDKFSHMCAKHKRMMLPNVPGCKFHEAHEEMLIRESVREIHNQSRECEKIEFLLAMSLTSANMTTLFIEDFERRVKGAYKREKAKKDRQRETALLKKDLDLADRMDGALDKISKFAESIKESYYQFLKGFVEDIESNLEKIDAQYRHYIQSHVDKIFKKNGHYNSDASDSFQADAGEFAMILLEFARIAHHNEANVDKVYKFMQEITNENAEGKPNSFCLDAKDVAHYKLKG